MIAAALAGGESKRFGGDKLLYSLGGKPIILYTIERLLSSSTIEEVVIVCGEDKRARYERLGFRVIVDELKVGPAGGVLTALKELGDVFIAGGDMPLINPKFVDLVVKRFYEDKCIVCIPQWSNGYLEPLHAAYSKSFARVLERRIGKGDYSLNGAIREINFCGIDVELLPGEFRDGLFNINRKSDLKKLLE